MTTIYENQSIAFTDLSGNTATISPNVGFTITTPTQTLTANVNGFTNGIESLLFSDLYAGVQKTESIIYAASTPTKLSVVDTIEILDAIPPLFNNTTTITPTQIIIADTANTFVSTHNGTSISFLTGGASSIYEDTGLTIDDGTNTIDLRGSSLNFDDNTTANASYRLDGATISNVGGYFSYLDPSELRFTASISTNQTVLDASTLTLTDGTITNTLNKSDWTGTIKTTTSTQNLTHYINMSDALGTGQGNPQKSALITANPSTGIITASGFSGNSTSSTTAVGVNLTSDNFNGVYYIPFSKTTTTTGNALYVDNISGPLSYNPSTSLLSCAFINGQLTQPIANNTATFSGGTLTISGSNVSFKNSNITFTGTTNTVTNLTLTGMIVGGEYKIGIFNNGSGNLTFNTGLGTNIRTLYNSNININSGTYGFLIINVLNINALTVFCVQVTQLT